VLGIEVNSGSRCQCGCRSRFCSWPLRPAEPSRRGSGSVGALRAGQVWIRSMPSKVRSGIAAWLARSDLGFAPRLAGRSRCQRPVTTGGVAMVDQSQLYGTDRK
jgi:hypothetical protein